MASTVWSALSAAARRVRSSAISAWRATMRSSVSTAGAGAEAGTVFAGAISPSSRDTTDPDPDPSTDFFGRPTGRFGCAAFSASFAAFATSFSASFAAFAAAFSASVRRPVVRQPLHRSLLSQSCDLHRTSSRLSLLSRLLLSSGR